MDKKRRKINKQKQNNDIQDGFDVPLVKLKEQTSISSSIMEYNMLVSIRALLKYAVQGFSQSCAIMTQSMQVFIST